MASRSTIPRQRQPERRVGLQVAAELLDAFRDGVWFVNLARVADPELVPSTIATTLGLQEAGGRSPSEVL